jgi:hypothetical protein
MESGRAPAYRLARVSPASDGGIVLIADALSGVGLAQWRGQLSPVLIIKAAVLTGPLALAPLVP